jgi:RimJ/RimL family protein N-acetyltransferase
MIDAREHYLEDTLRDGRPIVIRATKADDRERVRTAFSKLERQTIYTRWFSHKKELSESELEEITEPDFETMVALVVTLPEDGEEVVIAGARYMVFEGVHGIRVAEIAFTVEEEYQGHGLASRLLAELAQIARAKGIVRFEADVLPKNKAMLKVFEKSGMAMTLSREDGYIHLMLALDR